MNKIAIISPSGQFYGSEQVLWDYLATTRNRYDVYMPQGIFFKKINEQNKHTPILYSSVRWLYIRLIIMLIFGKYDGVYINEGGHIKYLNILADMFSHKRFFVHIRLLEDCQKQRLGRKRKNISYISISEYITKEVERNTQIHCTTLYDIYKPTSGFCGIRNLELKSNVCRLGIIGRVTTTKGLYDIARFCEYCETHESSLKWEFHFFGGIDSQIPEVCTFVERAKSYKQIKCIFHGFVNSKREIYQSIDVLTHFNKVEAWGRILMEALDFGIPFIAFLAGGAGEMSRKFKVGEKMIPDTDNWEEIFQKRLVDFIFHSNKTIEEFENAKKEMILLCNPQVYTNQLEKLFNE